ncbi:MFS transporter [Opitutaceae bacterium]
MNPSAPPTSDARSWLARLTKIEPGEGPAVVAAFFLYFCLLGGYFAVRPVRETVGTLLGSDRVSDLFVTTWIFSILIVPAYGAICARLQRRVFLPWIYGFVALALAGCGVAFAQNETNVFVGQFFYVMISVLNLFVVSVLWSFLLELFDSGQVKRLFGVIAAGGTAGALAGPIMTDLLVGRIGNSGILFVGAGMFCLAIACQRILLHIWARRGWTTNVAPVDDRPMGGNPFAGFTLVLKSPYLLGIALFVVLLASVNTFLYFEQLELVRATFTSSAERTQVFSRIDYVVQSLTILSQLFLTGRIASRFGVGALLTMVPLVMVGGMLLLASFHTFAVLAVVFVIRRWGEYAFVRPGREMLFSRVDNETKYKAKNFIDVTVYRGADALGAKISNAIRDSGGSPALMGAMFAVAWAVNGAWLGRRREHGNEGRKA